MTGGIFRDKRFILNDFKGKSKKGWISSEVKKVSVINKPKIKRKFKKENSKLER